LKGLKVMMKQDRKEEMKHRWKEGMKMEEKVGSK
jgi:hypothetical protein